MLIAAFCGSLGYGCGSDTNNTGGTGGTSGSGGHAGTTAQGSGGDFGAGGASTHGLGGSTDSGSGVGGSTSGEAGRGNAGGSRDAGASAGGAAGSGRGGGGAGGASTSGTGGARATDGGTDPSAGCGSSNTTSPCSKSGTKCSLDVSSTTRTYYVQLPTNYEPSKPYPVVFQFHPMGGSAEMALNMYNLQSAGLSSAIFVTPQGLVSASPGSDAGSAGWANTNGQDIAFAKAMLADVQSKYCVDNARIFSTGFSYGGMMSFAVGCEMSDVFRAIAPMSGALYSDFNCKGTGHAIAMWGSHGLSDNVVPIADGRSARDKILLENHCGTATTPIDPSPCVSYQGCDQGYPVTWCEFDGTHQLPSFGSKSIAAFFNQF